ncbi:MAG: N-acetylmuramoyl-L-alanine amidase [Planctomycetes bacterium]|nr:N-acetylmuramoyl-L-alanine amidase [Planctomycetota bacterium]
MKLSRRALALLPLLLLGACRTPAALRPDPHASAVVAAAPTVGQEIVLGGHRIPIGRPVVLWTDPGGYDAYDRTIRPGTQPDYAEDGLRYTPGRTTRDAEKRALVRVGSTDLDELARGIDQFVVHYDVCALSKTCWEVLQHQRGLSVHFMLDVDGTLYQTLDLRETAWHATKSNPRSIGVEIAQIGAWPPNDTKALERWYAEDARGTYLRIPPEKGDGGVRTPGFVGRPARPGRFVGTLNGVRLEQYDFTDEQYETLAALLAVLCRELPRLRPDVPRDAAGRVRTDVLSDEEWAAYSGILGHLHVQKNKYDPGPAFDWERLVREVRARM